MMVCPHTTLKKPRKSLEEWNEVVILPQLWFGGECALMAPQSSIFVGQFNSAVAAKEHSRVHLCLGLALRKS
ncbi:unnamed protein product [Nezara viridula]|uniref:Uncharacterized protein n=1 Tax=Nezara viridula TaxID=85310 RepID=A0A9P0GZ59_NEZVI|nr:unnamed protein product [Nezara viridula]